MPTRGYRKGVSDAKKPRPHLLRTRTSTPVYQKLAAESDARSITLSALINRVLEAHVTGERARLPHPRTADATLLYEWNRTGNNLNQLARQAHLMRLPLIEKDARACLAAIKALIDRMP